MSRQRVVQALPPASLDGFPVTAHADAVYRVARREPWWFCTCGDCRFDLSPGAPGGLGTLYAGTDPITGVLETIGPELTGLPVARTFLAERTVWILGYDRPLELADLCHPAAVGFGVTNELSTMVPYSRPQAWAEAFAERGLDGISYRTRFSTEREPTGVALFDEAGHHDWIAVASCRADDDSVVAALSTRRIVVADIPSSSSMQIVG